MLRFWRHKKPKHEPVYYTDYPENCRGCARKRTTDCPDPVDKANCISRKPITITQPPPEPDYAKQGKAKCPHCGSYNTKRTYSERFECSKCGSVFN